MATQAELTSFIEFEQELLWDSLDKALKFAINGVWSMEAESLLGRIIIAARLVGPTPWEKIQWPLLAGGIYAELLKAADLPVRVPSTSEEWQELDKKMGNYPGGTKQYLERHWAKTCVEVRKAATYMREVGEI